MCLVTFFFSSCHVFSFILQPCTYVLPLHFFLVRLVCFLNRSAHLVLFFFLYVTAFHLHSSANALFTKLICFTIRHRALSFSPLLVIATPPSYFVAIFFARSPIPNAPQTCKLFWKKKKPKMCKNRAMLHRQPFFFSTYENSNFYSAVEIQKVKDPR